MSLTPQPVRAPGEGRPLRFVLGEMVGEGGFGLHTVPSNCGLQGEGAPGGCHPAPGPEPRRKLMTAGWAGSQNAQGARSCDAVRAPAGPGLGL